MDGLGTQELLASYVHMLGYSHALTGIQLFLRAFHQVSRPGACMHAEVRPQWAGEETGELFGLERLLQR